MAPMPHLHTDSRIVTIFLPSDPDLSITDIYHIFEAQWVFGLSTSHFRLRSNLGNDIHDQYEFLKLYENRLRDSQVSTKVSSIHLDDGSSISLCEAALPSHQDTPLPALHLQIKHIPAYITAPEIEAEVRSLTGTTNSSLRIYPDTLSLTAVFEVDSKETFDNILSRPFIAHQLSNWTISPAPTTPPTRTQPAEPSLERLLDLFPAIVNSPALPAAVESKADVPIYGQDEDMEA
jgi:hypothetical protein